MPNDGPQAGTGAAVAKGFSRRAFLVRSSLAAGTVAVVGSVPGIGSLLSAAEPDAQEIEGGAASTGAGAAAELAPMSEGPIVAHVVDVGSGEINFYQGTAQVITRDPALARAIARLAMARG